MCAARRGTLPVAGALPERKRRPTGKLEGPCRLSLLLATDVTESPERGATGGTIVNTGTLKLLLAVSLILQTSMLSHAQCAADGSDYTYVETVSGTTRTVVTNHCPNHVWTAINPNYPIAGDTTYTMPSQPMYDESTEKDLTLQGGTVGVIFDGSMLFSGYAGPNIGQQTNYATSATSLEGDTFDSCGGHASSIFAASYHIHIPPNCLLRQLGATDSTHSPQIGWAVDGFPVYGPRGFGGKMMKICSIDSSTPCLDACGGLWDPDQTYLADGYKYRYFVQGEYTDGFVATNPNVYGYSSAEYYPFTPACYRGCCPSGVSCSNVINACSVSAVVGYTAVRAAQSAMAVNPYPDGVTTAETAPSTPTPVSSVQLVQVATAAEQQREQQTRQTSPSPPPPVMKPPRPVLSLDDVHELTAAAREFYPGHHSVVEPGKPGSNVEQDTDPDGHNCPPGYHVMGDHRGGKYMGKKKYWCMKNEKMNKMADFQNTLDPNGVSTVKGSRGVSTQKSMFAARLTAESNNVVHRNSADDVRELVTRTRKMVANTNRARISRAVAG